MDDVCSQLQKELGSNGLFGGKGELSMASKTEKVETAVANKVAYKQGGDRRVTCEHCKKQGHSKNNCWVLHPHLRSPSTSKFSQTRAHEAVHNHEAGKAMVSTSHSVGATSQIPNDDAFIRNSDIKALIKDLKANSGNISINALNSIHNASHTARPLIIDSGASHHMIRDAKLITDVKPALGSVVIANGNKIPIERV